MRAPLLFAITIALTSTPAWAGDIQVPGTFGLGDDLDFDGVADYADIDIDGDGVPNCEGSDMDGDGEPNSTDIDIDGDGFPNGADPDIDADGDGAQDDQPIPDFPGGC